MPLYAVVLRFPDRDEIRLTGRNGYRLGDEILIAGRRFLVTDIQRVNDGGESPPALRVDQRFLLESRDEPEPR